MSSDVVFDPAAAHPEVGAVRSAVQARNWRACRAVLDAVDQVSRTKLIREGAELPELEDFLRDVLRSDPADGAAIAMLGYHLTRVGWNIRSGARAEHVSREQFDTFHGWLRRAERVYVDGIARVPDDPAIWCLRITSGMGLELGISEARRRYDRMSRLTADHMPAATALLQQICPKWGGTWEMAHTFARETMLSVPPGSFSQLVVPIAHIEHWLDLPEGEDLAYMSSPAVRAELHDAARRSVWDPSFRRTLGWIDVMSTFAMAFSLAGDQPAAASLFQALGPYAQRWPWSYLGDAEAAIRERRQWTMPAAGGVR